jgi:pSer/pThr/pTyr-binding forkhead associated (FHA) protein
MSRKLIVNDGRETRELLVAGTMGVGRDPICEISADDPLLSRRHAEFRATPEGVVLSDLDSRNGIRVNGIVTKRAVLRDGDQIQIAGFVIQLVDRREPVPPSSSADDDGTVVMMAPASAASTPPRTPVVEAADDRTIVRLPPPAAANEVRQPAGVQANVRRDAPARRPDAPAAAKTPPPAVAREARTSWTGRVFVQVIGLAVFSLVMVAIVMSLWGARTVRSIAMARATANVNWLAADAALASDRGDLGGSVDAVSREPGVMTALVVGLDGRILSPASRSGETINTLPGLDVSPSEIYRARAGGGGGLVHVARPLSGRQGARLAIAFVSFRVSAGPDDSSALVVLAPVVLMVLGAAIFVASSIRRTTLQGLTRFNEDIDLAISGQLLEVKDPLGARPVRNLADTVNYLIVRARGTGAAGAIAAGAKRKSDAPDTGGRVPAPRDDRGSGRAPAHAAAIEARVVADARFRVTDASPECEQIIGVTPRQMMGEHLVDALQIKPLVEAVLTILGSLPATGRQQTTVAREGLASLAVVVARSGKDQPVTVTISVADSAVRV